MKKGRRIVEDWGEVVLENTNKYPPCSGKSTYNIDTYPPHVFINHENSVKGGVQKCWLCGKTQSEGNHIPRSELQKMIYESIKNSERAHAKRQ